MLSVVMLMNLLFVYLFCSVIPQQEQCKPLHVSSGCNRKKWYPEKLVAFLDQESQITVPPIIHVSRRRTLSTGHPLH